MTMNRLNEIAELINARSLKLNQIKSAIEIALGENFLDHPKSVIYAHLSMLDDRIAELIELNKSIGIEVIL